MKTRVCKACDTLHPALLRMWVCRDCSVKCCEHKMNPYAMRVDGSGYCRKCAWRRNRVTTINERLARLGLSPIVVNTEPVEEPE